MRAFLLAFGVSLVLAAPAAALQPIQPWDGQNPFNCELQQLGTGVEYPDPDADPLCVEFDKTQQNVTPELGLADFLANEPARVAAALPKCFYYQHDHWTGSIVQGEAPELWNWDGSYFFDKARSLGGVHIENFRIGGQPFDGTPYAPPEYQPYLEEGGGGGVWLALEVPGDPACAAMVDTPEERAKIYRSAPAERDCADTRGNVGRRGIGKLRLRKSRRSLQDTFGSPERSGETADRWCAVGGGAIGAAFPGARSGIVVTSSPGHAIENVGPRSRSKRVRQQLDAKLRFQLGKTRVYRVKHHGAPAYAGLQKGQVSWIALRSKGRVGSVRSLKGLLRAYLRL